MFPHIKNLKEIQIKKVKSLRRTKNLFKNNKIDMLFLIPEKTSRNYEIFVIKFTKNNEEWLRCWYCHNRGSGRQLEIKRYIKIKTFGNLLGQYQAEGNKNRNKKYPKYQTAFTNKLIEEHKEFIENISNLGINKEKIITRLKYNPSKLSKDNKKKSIKEFINVIKLIPKTSESFSIKGHSFETLIRNTLLFEIINNSLNKIKENLISNNNLQNKILFNSFLSKLLTGDGSIEYRLRYNKGIQSRFKITEGNRYERERIKEILKKQGFSVYIKDRDIRSYCKFKDLIYLYKIKAFKNTNNWYKLIAIIRAYIEKRNILINQKYLKNIIKENGSPISILESLKVR